MTAFLRRGGSAVLLAAAVLGAGCNASSLAYFLFPERKHDPDIKKIAADDKRDVKVVILTYSPQLEFVHADREMSQVFAQTLRKLCEDNGENVTIVHPRKVEEFKSSHPEWHALPDLGEVGKQLKADYVIYVEVSQLKLYEEHTANQFYRGYASLSVQLIDVNKPDESTDAKQFTVTYPDAKGPLPVEDSTEGVFRQAFLGYVAKKLAWCFTGSPIQEHYWVE
jgi:hypothetical protein